jgi:hypothetical protein
MFTMITHIMKMYNFLSSELQAMDFFSFFNATIFSSFGLH